MSTKEFLIELHDHMILKHVLFSIFLTTAFGLPVLLSDIAWIFKAILWLAGATGTFWYSFNQWQIAKKHNKSFVFFIILDKVITKIPGIKALTKKEKVKVEDDTKSDNSNK